MKATIKDRRPVITRDALIRQLAEFFHDSFSDDPIGVNDWVIQGDVDAEVFFETLNREFPRS